MVCIGKWDLLFNMLSPVIKVIVNCGEMVLILTAQTTLVTDISDAEEALSRASAAVKTYGLQAVQKVKALKKQGLQFQGHPYTF